MTQEQEKQLLQAIYDRLFDAVTYQPAGSKNPFTESETFIHFSKNAAVDLKSFANPRTPSNPLGDLKTSEEFSRLVDQVSPMTLEWENTGNQLSKTYKQIVDSANANTVPDQTAQDMYDTAYNYLHPETKSENPSTHEVVVERTDSPDYVAYEDNMNDYLTAIQSYRLAYNMYLDDLEDPDATVRKKADRNWQVMALGLENEIKKTLRKLGAGNAKYVEQALNILNTTINDGIRQAISAAQDAVRDDRAFSSSLGQGDKWFLSYPVPTNWTDEKNLSFSELKINGGNTTIRSKSTEHSFSVDTSVNYGLWRVKASAGGTFQHSNSSTDKDSVEIAAKIAKVEIKRPWFLESIFRLQNWSTNLVNNKGGISNGKIDTSNKTGLIPMYPVAFVVASDIRIKANFSHEDEEHIKESAHASTSVGWGPFSIGGSYGYGKTDDEFHSDYQNGEIRVPGMQIIAWISRVVPFSPQ